MSLLSCLGILWSAHVPSIFRAFLRWPQFRQSLQCENFHCQSADCVRKERLVPSSTTSIFNSEPFAANWPVFWFHILPLSFIMYISLNHPPTQLLKNNHRNVMSHFRWLSFTSESDRIFHCLPNQYLKLVLLDGSKEKMTLSSCPHNCCLETNLSNNGS